MTSILLVQAPDPRAPQFGDDFAGAGFHVLGPVGCADMVRQAVKGEPAVVACWQPREDTAFIEALKALQAQQPVPVVVFTQDAGADWMKQALEAGVHAWVVQGYGANRLRPLVQLAQERFARERGLRDELSELGARFEERKLVDKAKGILMRSRQMSEDEAFQLLRTASMHGNQRVGQVSRHVIDTALFAEAVNRAGQQRMLSQRVVKLYALACAGTEAQAAQLLVRQSVERIDDNLAVLEKTLSTATFGDLIAATRGAWEPVRAILGKPAEAAKLDDLDALADALLAHADAFVAALEGAGIATTVGVINVSGRQRMLSQRLAKLALLKASGSPVGKEAIAATQQAFEDGLAALAQAPLTSNDIRDALAQARAAWDRLQKGIAKAGSGAGRTEIAAASEDLLALFDRLTDAYQHSLQVLMG